MQLGLPLAAKIYLSGPMTGIPDFNFPEFDRIAKNLRDAGYDVVSPADLNRKREDAGQVLSEIFYSDFMKEDIRELSKCDAIYMMKGWRYSPGAKHELENALVFALTVFFQEGS